jgi:hypothetical protein
LIAPLLAISTSKGKGYIRANKGNEEFGSVSFLPRSIRGANRKESLVYMQIGREGRGSHRHIDCFVTRTKIKKGGKEKTKMRQLLLVFRGAYSTYLDPEHT